MYVVYYAAHPEREGMGGMGWHGMAWHGDDMGMEERQK